MAERNLFLSRVRDGLSRRWRRLGVEIASRTGRYRYLREVDWGGVERLVFVCSGNICRSPYAEHLARAWGVPAVSFGITALSGSRADPSAIEVAQQFHIDMRTHRSLAREDLAFARSDLLVAMDLGHLEVGLEVCRKARAQSTLLGLWDGQHPVLIQDPFGCSTDDFRACFERIEACLHGMLEAAIQDNPALSKIESQRSFQSLT